MTNMLKKIAIFAAALVLLTALVLAAWYQVDGIPDPETRTYLESDSYTSVIEADGSLRFVPEESNGLGIVIMHGALIKPQSYAQSAGYFATLGYTVLLPAGPGRMSIAAVSGMGERLRQEALDGWFFIGHSMGGMASLDSIRTHDLDVRAVALWATAMPADFSDLQLPVLFIWGDTDGLLPRERFERSRLHLPADTEYITLVGANHRNFAMYTHQFFDDDATIDRDAQIHFANRTTAVFFQRFR